MPKHYKNHLPALAMPSRHDAGYPASDPFALQPFQEAALARLLDRSEAYGDNIIEMLRTSGRVVALTASRESSKGAEVQLGDLLHTTMLENMDLPGAQQVIEAGLRPLLELPPPFPCLRFNLRKLKAVLYSVEGVWHFVALGSAALVTEAQENTYAEVMCDILALLRPHRLCALNVARLLRSVKVGGQVRAAIEEHVLEVRVGGINLDVRNQMSGFAFATFAELAAVERDWIVMRLSMGRVANWRRGEWYFDEVRVPYGYVLDDAGKMVPDPSQRELVTSILKVLGEPDVTPRLMVRRLGALGLRTKDKGALSGRDLAYVKGARKAVDSLLRYVDLWSTGLITVRPEVPLKTTGTYCGCEVVFDTPADETRGLGRIELTYEPGLPEGGWADEDTLARAQLAARSRMGLDDWDGEGSGRTGGAAKLIQRTFNSLHVAGPDGVPLRIRLVAAGRDLFDLVGR